MKSIEKAVKLYGMTFIKLKKDKITFLHLYLLVNEQTITDKLNKAVNFNNFFTSVGKKLQKKIYPTNRDYSYHLKSPNRNTFFTSPTSSEEVINVIQDLKTGQSTCPNSLPQKIIKQTKENYIPSTF